MSTTGGYCELGDIRETEQHTQRKRPLIVVLMTIVGGVKAARSTRSSRDCEQMQEMRDHS